MSQPPVSPEPEPSDHAQPSFLEDMTDAELSRALSYYYHHPQALPYRESGAHRRADDPTPEVLVRFDEDIFRRKKCLRPVPDDELESVDPFTVDITIRN